MHMATIPAATHTGPGTPVSKHVQQHSDYTFNITNKCTHTVEYTHIYCLSKGWDSSVGIATRYGLDGPGIESRRGRDFPHPSRPPLWPTQPSIQWVPGLSRG